MKFKFILLALFLFSAIIGYGQNAETKEKRQDTVAFIVGMHCQACKERIEKAISMERGVKDLEVNLEKKEVKVIFNPKKTDPQKIEEAIKELGYTVTLKKNE
jgi:copper chaperone CopZ